MKPKAAYIDHSFKRKTKSNQFLKDFYSLKYSLTEFSDYTWKGGQTVSVEEINRNNYKAVIFNQNLPPSDYIRKLKAKKIIWSPMYDQGIVGYKRIFGRIPYLDLNIKIFSLSKIVHCFFLKLGFDSTFFQYFPSANSRFQRSRQGIRVFHWLRREKINWSILKKILGRNKIDSITLRVVPDPGQIIKLPPKKDIKKYKIKIIKKWLPRNQYLKLIAESNVYIAPRPAEGVGLSFLEAMAQGLAVIAPNNTTMNEYIINGVNGYLYDLKNPQELDLTNYLRVGEKARESIKRGRKRWEKEKYRILAQLNKPVKKCFWGKLLFLKSLYHSYAILKNIGCFRLPAKK